MKQTAITRIERLERRDMPRDPLVIVRHIIVSPDGAIRRADCLQSSDGRAWRRSIGETPEGFEDRVKEEARQGANGRTVTLRPVSTSQASVAPPGLPVVIVIVALSAVVVVAVVVRVCLVMRRDIGAITSCVTRNIVVIGV